MSFTSRILIMTVVVPDFSGFPPSTAVSKRRNSPCFSLSKAFSNTSSGNLLPSLLVSTFRIKQSFGLKK
uniref:Uncharacterized protein n=1 Tax=Paramormyrops kingsleyae TaxID=1676925 RepID=A0A3B3T6H6_9TELE